MSLPHCLCANLQEGLCLNICNLLSLLIIQISKYVSTNRARMMFFSSRKEYQCLKKHKKIPQGLTLQNLFVD